MPTIEEFTAFFKENLVSPGKGVHTVSTGNRVEELNKIIFNAKVPNWPEFLNSTINEDNPFLFGICSDTGGGIHRGAAWGPLELRKALYNEVPFHEVNDLGDVLVIPHLLHDKYLNEETLKECRKSIYDDLNSKLPVSPLSIAELLTDKILETFKSPRFLMLGGDHSVSYPTCLSFFKHNKNQNVGLLHFDAHTDLLDKRLGIDLCFGSWTYHIIHQVLDPQKLVQVGIRASGKERAYWENKFPINQIWSHEVVKKGAKTLSEEIIQHFQKQKVERIYLSFDIDALDASIAHSTGTPEVSGLNLETSLEIIERVGKEIDIQAADLVEVAPFIQFPEFENNKVNSTVKAGKEILKTLITELKRT